MAKSPEIETLDQLLGGEMRLSVIRQLYHSDSTFTRGTLALLQSGDVRLVDEEGVEVPRWRWVPLFDRGEVLPVLQAFMLQVTKAGAARVS